MDVVRLPDAEACARRTAQLMAEAVDGGARHLALSGGSSPERAYALLGPKVPDWSLVDLWYSDERCVRPDHEDSNHRMAFEALQAPGAVWHRMEGELGPMDAARNYARELQGIVPQPKRGHQGWRYLEEDGAPTPGDVDESGVGMLPPRLYGKLNSLALL